MTGSASNDVWAVSLLGGIIRWDGAAWATSDAMASSYKLWLNQNNDVWTEQSLHWDGTSWSSIPPGPMTSRNNIWGASGNDIWVVGNNGNITHWDGSVWKQVTSPTTNFLYAVGGSSSTDVWAVGGGSSSGGAIIIHWDGTSFTPVLSDSMNELYSVWASASDSAWAVGSEILYWNGTTWAVVPPGACGGFLQNVFGLSRSDVWFVGNGGGPATGVACHYP
jgi:hypothetical protein